jgi:hypothetical protein
MDVSDNALWIVAFTQDNQQPEGMGNPTSAVGWKPSIHVDFQIVQRDSEWRTKCSENISMKRNNHTYKILENTHYKSERQFKFKDYIAKLLEAFEILEDNGMGKNKLRRVKILLDCIQSDYQMVILANTTTMMNDTMHTSLQVAIDCLFEFIGQHFWETHPITVREQQEKYLEWRDRP